MCPTSSRLNDRGLRWQWIRLRNFLGRHEQAQCESSPCAVSTPLVVKKPTVTEDHSYKPWLHHNLNPNNSVEFRVQQFKLVNFVPWLRGWHAASLKTVTKDHSGGWARSYIKSLVSSTNRSLEPHNQKAIILLAQKSDFTSFAQPATSCSIIMLRANPQ